MSYQDDKGIGLITTGQVFEAGDIEVIIKAADLFDIARICIHFPFSGIIHTNQSIRVGNRANQFVDTHEIDTGFTAGEAIDIHATQGCRAGAAEAIEGQSVVYIQTDNRVEGAEVQHSRAFGVCTATDQDHIEGAVGDGRCHAGKTICARSAEDSVDIVKGANGCISTSIPIQRTQAIKDDILTITVHAVI